jgi:very-short-patch-repair endonuclease
MVYEIRKEEWHVCRLCGKTIQELAKVYGGGGVYYIDVFRKHLNQDHNTTTEDYFGPPPTCVCGICNQQCVINIRGDSNYRWREWMCGRHPGTLEWSEKAKTERLGVNNPMYGKKPWNKGKNKNNDPTMKDKAERAKGRITLEHVKEKQSQSAKKRTIHGHTGHKHSQKTKDDGRIRTLKMIQDGVFKQNRTQPYIKMEELLQSLNIFFIEEQIVHYWSFDFFIPKFNLYIEVDGDYFHSNPRRWPDGPKSKTQKINYYRDKKKNEFCQENNMVLHRFWEYDILNNTEEVLCILKTLFQSNQ